MANLSKQDYFHPETGNNVFGIIENEPPYIDCDGIQPVGYNFEGNSFSYKYEEGDIF